jgi:seryl-tRNA synthetase
MKNRILLLLFLAFCTLGSTSTFAQKLTKKEKAEQKKWKKKMKEVDPLEFKEMTEKVNNMQRENNVLKTQITRLQESQGSMQAELEEKQRQVENLLAQVEDAKSNTIASFGPDGDDWSKGVVYKVQIGAFRNKDLSRYQDQGNFWIEDSDGVKKYTIARFRDYDVATHFKNYMREMGVKDAWIVAYEDNQRKDINDVMGSN